MQRIYRTRLVLLVLAIALTALLVSWRYLAAPTGPDSDGTYQTPHPASSIGHSPSSPSPAATEAVTLDTVLGLANQIRENIAANVSDYTAELVKRERIHGQLGASVHMKIKVRNPRQVGDKVIPFAAYLRFIPPSAAVGREVIWVDGQNNNCLVAHEAGLLNFKRAELAPDGLLAMMGNKYPITELGLLRLAEKLIEKGQRDRELGDCKVEIFDDQVVGDRTCKLIQITHEVRQEGMDFHIAQVFVDMERMVPLRYASYLWPETPGEPPPLEEEYTYLNVQTNVGLTDQDFDPDNESYDFP